MGATVRGSGIIAFERVLKVPANNFEVAATHNALSLGEV
jgi:hypothetical protein